MKYTCLIGSCNNDIVQLKSKNSLCVWNTGLPIELLGRINNENIHALESLRGWAETLNFEFRLLGTAQKTP